MQYSGAGEWAGGAVVGSRCRLGTGGGHTLLGFSFRFARRGSGALGSRPPGQTRGLLLLAPCPGAFRPLPTRSEDGPCVPAQNSQRLSAGRARGWAVSPARAPAAPTCCCCCCFPGGGRRRPAGTPGTPRSLERRVGSAQGLRGPLPSSVRSLAPWVRASPSAKHFTSVLRCAEEARTPCTCAVLPKPI